MASILSLIYLLNISFIFLQLHICSLWLHRYKHIGVVTAALIVKNMVKDDENDTTTSTVESESARSKALAVKEAENLLSLVMSSTASSPIASALFMDELASISLREKMNSKLEVLVDKTPACKSFQL